MFTCTHPDVVLLYLHISYISLNSENSLFDLNQWIPGYEVASERERPTYILFPHFIYIKWSPFEFAENKYLKRLDLGWKGVCLQHVRCVVWAQGFNILTGKIFMCSLSAAFTFLHDGITD